jgi:hypothetical protein
MEKEDDVLKSFDSDEFLDVDLISSNDSNTP